MQDEIAKAIAGKLKITLAGGASERIAKPATANVEAYEAYLRGRALLLKRGRHVTPGMEQLSPNFTQGRLWRAIFCQQMIGGRLAEGAADARRAFENDPLSAYSTSLFGLILGIAGESAEALTLARLGASRDPKTSTPCRRRFMSRASCWHC